MRRSTWAIGEAAEQELAENALTRLKDAHRKAWEAIAELHAARAAAERAARNAIDSEYAHVREAVAPIASALMSTAIERVVAMGEATWEKMAEELDPIDGTQAPEAHALWRGDLGRALFLWRGIYGSGKDDPVGALVSMVRQTKEGLAGLAKMDQTGRLAMAAEFWGSGYAHDQREDQQRLVAIGREMFGERGPATEEQVRQVEKRAREQGIRHTLHFVQRLADGELEVIDPALAAAEFGDGDGG
jgi:hypothetical protein